MSNPLTKIMDLALGKTYQALERPKPISPANLCRLVRENLEKSLEFGVPLMVRTDAINQACNRLEQLGSIAVKHSNLAADRWAITYRLVTDARDDVGWWRDCVKTALDKIDQLEEALR